MEARTLSEEDLTVFFAVAYGDTHKVIARDYDLHPQTISNRLSRAYKNLEVDSGLKATLTVLSSGLLRIEQIISANYFNADGIFILNKTQLGILEQLQYGLSNKEIADVIGLSEKTIKNNLTIIFENLNIFSRIQAGIASTLLFNPEKLAV